MKDESVIVIGGGVAGLTAASLLVYEGFKVTLLEAHSQVGGCAGTFKRGPYIFDVGATQVAGLEPNGIHQRIFNYLNWPVPKAEILDPACVVDLGDGSEPIKLWHDFQKWDTERNRQFPGSKNFWAFCSFLHKTNWAFVQRNPILPINNFWDFRQFSKAIRLTTLFSGFFANSSIEDLLRLCSCEKDFRLKKFLDLQLKLYSQNGADQTAALYGSTVLQMAQSPLGLFHLQGSMQELSNSLLSCFLRDGGQLLLRHKLVGLQAGRKGQPWKLDVLDHRGSRINFNSSNLIFTLPPQLLLNLIPTGYGLPANYRQKLMNLPKPSGAIVFYGALDRNALPQDCPNHLQFEIQDPGSLFVSVSREGDGRAPFGKATVIVSLFADIDLWCTFDENQYQKNKAILLAKIISALYQCLGISSKSWIHKELATPQSFAKWTGRPKGMVGGLGQTPQYFGPYGLPSRTPMPGLWLCGDSIHPGEGTAGVSQSALMACRQFMATYSRELVVI